MHHLGVLVVWDLLQQLYIVRVTQTLHELLRVALALRIPVSIDLRQIWRLADILPFLQFTVSQGFFGLLDERQVVFIERVAGIAIGDL